MFLTTTVIIRVLYTDGDGWYYILMQWLHVKLSYFIGRKSSEIISKLFQQHWRCWRIFTSRDNFSQSHRVADSRDNDASAANIRPSSADIFILTMELLRLILVQVNPLNPSAIIQSHFECSAVQRHPGLTCIFNFWHSDTLALSPERQSVRMSETDNGRLGCMNKKSNTLRSWALKG